MHGLKVLPVGALAVYAGRALYLYVFQARFIDFPDLPSRQVDATPADMGLAYEAVRLKTENGETLAGWCIPSPAARATLLYPHGNGGNIGRRLDPIAVFHRLGLNVFIIDYRGYGDSTGKPGEAGSYQDALAAWNYLPQQKRIRPEQIVLFGESLGGSIAAWLAARHTPAAMVLYASFTSLPEMAQALYPIFPARWLARYRYDTRAALRGVNCPLLIPHSPEDEIIPFSHGQWLFEAANAPKRLIELRAGHNDALRVSRAISAREVDPFLRQFTSGDVAAQGQGSGEWQCKSVTPLIRRTMLDRFSPCETGCLQTSRANSPSPRASLRHLTGPAAPTS